MWHSLFSSLAALWFGQSGSCPDQLLAQIHRQAQLQPTVSFRQFRRFARRLPRELGMTEADVIQRYEGISAQKQLLQLMLGQPQGNVNLSAGWGEDFTFVPNFQHWFTVEENLGPLAGRITERLQLSPTLGKDLFVNDHTSVGDAGWVIAAGKDAHGATTHGSLKLTYFNWDTTPDGAWPRFAFVSQIRAESLLMYRFPRRIDHESADAALAGEGYLLQSSLSKWGLFPAEIATGYQMPEREVKLSAAFQRAHYFQMIDVIEARGTPQLDNELKRLRELRELAKVSETMKGFAEVGRFNIPPGSPPATKAQLFYGLTVLLMSRPIHTVIALAPRADPRPGVEPYRPQVEILLPPPTGGPMDAMVEAMAAFALKENGPVPPPEATAPARDLLRESYEALGMQVIHETSYCPGLRNGAYVFRVKRDLFLERLIAVALEKPGHLLPQQEQYLQDVRKGLQL